jgi:hypothetical protein
MKTIQKLWNKREIEYLIENFENKIIKVVSKYKNYHDFLIENYDCYQHIKKNKLDYLLNNLEKTNISWDINLIKEKINEGHYKNIKEFRNNYSGAYEFLKRNNLKNIFYENNKLNK